MASTAVPLSSGTVSKPARASATDSGATPKDGKKRKDATPSFGVMWTIMRSIGDMSLPFFFSSLHISNQHLVPSYNTPLIVCSNHSNTILDVAILASHFPERRPLHFWAKAGFFKNPLTRFILTSSGNIKVDRRNKNNQALFEGTFEAMKVGGAIALFPEGGSYTIPKMANLKMGAAWAALEYSRYLQLQNELEQGEDGKGTGRPRTEVKILPSAVVFDDKSVFRSRAVLKFGRPISLDSYIDEFLSSPPPSSSPSSSPSKDPKATGVVKEDGTMPATPKSMTRANTSQGSAGGESDVKEQYASPAHRAVARLTADLQKAMQDLTFNAEDWETFQAVRLARELIFELTSDGAQVVKEGMDEYVELSRALMTLLTIDTATSSADKELNSKSRAARQSLFVYSCLLHLSNTENLTLARTTALPNPTPSSTFLKPLKFFLIRLPLYIPIFGPTLIPTYILPNKLAHHFAAREEESLSSVKTLFSFFFTTFLYSGLLVKTMQWTRWSPPGLFVGLAGIWFLHDLNRSNVDTAYGLVKQMNLGWRMWRAGVVPQVSSLKSPSDNHFFSGWSRIPPHHSSATTTAVKQSNAQQEPGKSLFFYGTLCHPKILSRVIGNDGSHLKIQNAVLDGAKLFHVKGEEYPGLLRFPPSSSTSSGSGSIHAVKGTLVQGLTSSDLQCLDAFEGDEYTRVPVSVIPDPLSNVENNATRIANVGGAPLHSILAKLTKERIRALCLTAKEGEKVEAEVYGWIAGEDKLIKGQIWEFDVFAREKAKNWIPDVDGDGKQTVEHDYEYQLVDKIHATSTSTITSSPPVTPSATEQAAASDWIQAHSSSITSHPATQQAIAKVVESLSQKPSIQFYVDKTFPRSEGAKRPAVGNKHLLEALIVSRSRARAALKDLLQALDKAQDQEASATTSATHEAVELLINAKSRALQRVGVDLDVTQEGIEGENGGLGWPFTDAQIRSTTGSRARESRKNI